MYPVKKSIMMYFVFIAAALLLFEFFCDECGATSKAPQIPREGHGFSRIALMPFLSGRLQASDQTIAKPLSKTLSQLTFDDQSLPEGSDTTMNRIVYDALKHRFPERLVPADLVSATYRRLSGNPANDTPRKLAVGLGEVLGADMIVVGTVWRFREKGEIPENPASVGFALYLVRVETGQRLWHDSFDGTQKVLSEDVLGGIKQIGMGLQWLTVQELARYGVKSMVKTIPLH